MSATTTRVRGLAPWQPQRATIDLLDKVQAVLVEYAQYLPLTIRQIFYRLVGAHGYDKTEQAYSRLGEHLNRARRAGLSSSARSAMTVSPSPSRLPGQMRPSSCTPS